MNFGLIPEFIGRLPVVSAVHQLRRDDLVQILTEPKNALVRQYQRFFGYDTIELVFTDDALWEIADQALERETGARGLRSIIESALLDVMFELPSRRDVTKCVITQRDDLEGPPPDARDARRPGRRARSSRRRHRLSRAPSLAELTSRTFSWSDPAESLLISSTLPGIELLRRMISGEVALPPIAALMSMRLLEVGPGRVVWEARPGIEHYNPIGTVHAGFTTTILDSAMGTAYVSVADAGARWTTLELKANFTRAITKDTGPVRCTGTVVHPGRTVVLTDARLEDADGRLLAHATSTILVLAD